MNPPLLFLSPARPDGQKSGLRIRARHALFALRQYHHVHAFHLHDGWGWELHGLPWFPAADPGLLWRRLRHRLKGSEVPEDRFFSRLAQLQLLTLTRVFGYRRIHVFRAAMIPLAAPLLRQPGVTMHLDLDEIESHTRRRLARLAELRGEPDKARAYLREADYFEELEADWLGRFDKVFLSSDLECARLRRQFPALKLEMLPNLPSEIPDLPLPHLSEPGGLLFVGNLDYYPNRDAVEWLLREIMPRLSGLGRLLVAGSGSWRPPAGVGVEDLGCPADLRGVYARSLFALAPLRAGGGTRIKALEAFAHARTVLATPLGLEGLDVCDEQQVFLAEHPDHFAQECLRLLRNPEVARSSGLRAYEWLRSQPGLQSWSQSLA